MTPLSLWSARFSLLVILLVFVLLRGGGGFGDISRDTILVAASILFLALNVPTVIWLVRRGRLDRAAGMLITLLVLRMAMAAWILWSVHAMGQGPRTTA